MDEYTPSPEAVEAAARAMYAERMLTGDFPDGPTEWDDLPEPWRDEWRAGATAALTAAGPIIAAEVERLRHVLREGQHMWDAAEQISRERDEALQRVADLRARVMGRAAEYRRRASGYREDEYADGQRAAYRAVAVDLEALAGS